MPSAECRAGRVASGEGPHGGPEAAVADRAARDGHRRGDHGLRAIPAHRAAGLAASNSSAGRHFDACTIPGSTRSSPPKNLATAGRSRKVTFSAIIWLRLSAILAIAAALMSFAGWDSAR